MSEYVRCVVAIGEDDVTVGRVYRCLPVTEDESREGLLRVVDNSGEDYLHSAFKFAELVPEEVDELQKARAYREAVEAEGQQRIEGME